MLTIDGTSLIPADVVKVARHDVRVALSSGAELAIQSSRQIVEDTLSRNVPVYGVTTGFGALQSNSITIDQLALLQRNIVVSHATGVGRAMSSDATRAMILLRVNALSLGYSGVTPGLVDALIALLNRDVTPFVPLRGSVGASGDLAPLAHMACVLIGEGAATYEGTLMSGSEALRAAGLEPIQLGAKEGLALTNGTQFMTALAGLAVADALSLARHADVIGALSLEALKGHRAAFQARVHAVRQHPGQEVVALNIRRLTEGSALCDRPNADPHMGGDLQDAYSLRCMPQVHGASRDAIRHCTEVITTEMNAATDNPLVFVETGEVISAGNFHGQPVALAIDFLKMAVAEIASISERRIARLLDKHLSRGLPAFLIESAGLNSGLMIPQYTAAALVSENKTLAHPAVVDSVPTSANQEDHNSMGSVGAIHLAQVVENAQFVLAIELLTASQALDFRIRDEGADALGRSTRAVWEHVREKIAFVETDRLMWSDIDAASRLLKDESILDVGLLGFSLA